MNGTEDTDSPSVEMSFRLRLEQVSTVREFLESYYQPLLRDPDLVCRMTMAAHELLENAVKYSGGGVSRLQVLVRGSAPSGTVSVRVWNVARPDLLDDLKVTVDELSSAASPFAIYQTYLARAAKRREGSGLGLARIRAEAEMTLSLEIEDGRVCVQAVAPLAPAEGP
jgi:anti-sigma regulatory factor (Ser/Thr protein kinase)